MICKNLAKVTDAIDEIVLYHEQAGTALPNRKSPPCY